MNKQTKLMLSGFASLCLIALPCAAQGRGASQGHGMGSGAASSGSHEPMGMGGGMGGDMSNGHGPSGASTNAHSSSAGGPKTAGELLSQNTKLSSNLQSLLPAGTDVQTASQGFKNLGQFVAAVHVSHNMGIPFDCLKADMTATAVPAGTTCAAGTGTNSKPMSLGASIGALKPDMSKSDATTAAKEGEHQAHDDLSQS